MTVGSLFSGIGVFEMAAERCGMRVAWSCEIDPFGRQVLAARFPGVTLYEDVRAIDPRELEWVDILTFGSPCQDWSVAGERAGIGGKRSGLFFEAIRIAHVLRPNWLVFENVPGLFSAWSPASHPPRAVETREFHSESEARGYASGIHGEWDVDETADFATVLAEFQELGYGGAYRVLDSQWFGVAQRRRRVFLVGGLGEQRLAALLPFLASGNGHPAPRRATRQDVAPTLAVRAGGSSETSFHTSGGLAVSPTLRSGGNRTGGDRPPGTDVDTCESLIVSPSLRAKANDPHRADMAAYVPTVAACITRREGKGPDSDCTTGLVAHTLRGEGNHSGEDGTGRGTPLVVAIAENQRGEVREMDVAAACTAGGGKPGSGYQAVAFTVRGREDGAQAECAEAGIANSLRTPGGGSSHQFVAFNWQAGGNSGTLDPNPEHTGCLQANQVPAVAFQERGRDGGPNLEVGGDAAYALTSPKGGGHRQEMNIATASHVRRLSPTECERLQGVSKRDPVTGEWSDGWTCLCGLNHGRSVAPPGQEPCRCPDGPRYRALGNAITEDVGFWVLSRVDEAEAAVTEGETE